MTSTTEKTYIAIGGTSGIGRAVAQALSARPGRVVQASRSTGLDMSKPAQLRDWFAQWAGFDHLVVTAGSQAPGGPLATLDLDAARAAFETKFWGSVEAARSAAGQIRPGGSITLTSGFVARRTVPGSFTKTAMNAAIEAVAKLMAREFAPIRVNVVSPGLTDTEAYSGMTDEARRAMMAAAAGRLPVGRVAQPGDVAAAYLYAIDNPSVTGTVIDIDGGALIS